MKNTSKYVAIVILMLKSTCLKAAMEGFVVGGAYIHIERFPHSAFLQVTCDNEKWICGSAILNQRILVTAGHCVEGCDFDEEETQVMALMGHADLQMVSVKRKVIDAVIHEDHNDVTLVNDIALAMVKKDIPLGSNVKRVVIPKIFPRHITGNKGYVAGWGVMTDIQPTSSSSRLKCVSQPLRSREECKVIGKMHSGMFCAGSADKDEGHPAQGDSGSAMITKEYYQIGVVSFCLRTYPALSVYTNVTYYYHWISSNAKELYCRNSK